MIINNYMPNYVFDGVTVSFPYTAYEPQKKFMMHVIKSLNEAINDENPKGSQNLLLESPTGTGKTLCLLCSCLAWRRHVLQTRGAFSVRGRQSKDKDKDKDDQLFSDTSIMEKVFIDNVEPEADCYTASINSPYKKRQKQKDRIELLKLQHEKHENESGLRIIYASRTHSQLKQVHRELLKTPYSTDAVHVTLGSRDHYCINHTINHLKGTQINSACRTAIKSKHCAYHLNYPRVVATMSRGHYNINRDTRVNNSLEEEMGYIDKMNEDESGELVNNFVTHDNNQIKEIKEADDSNLLFVRNGNGINETIKRNNSICGGKLNFKKKNSLISKRKRGEIENDIKNEIENNQRNIQIQRKKPTKPKPKPKAEAEDSLLNSPLPFESFIPISNQMNFADEYIASETKHCKPLFDVPLDIEDMKVDGHERAYCPFYVARDLASVANRNTGLIMVPYNYLFEPDILKVTMGGCALQGAIVVVDEGHNLPGVLEEAASFEFGEYDILGAMDDLKYGRSRTFLVKMESISIDDLDYLENFYERLLRKMMELPGQKNPQNGTFLLTFLETCGFDNRVTHVVKSLISGFESSSDPSEEKEKEEDKKEKEKEDKKEKDKKEKEKEKEESSARGIFTKTLCKVFELVGPDVSTQNRLVNYYRCNTIIGCSRSEQSPDQRMRSRSSSMRTINIRCVNVGFSLKDFLTKKGVLCLIITSGTLAPMVEFTKSLESVDFHIKFENDHVIPYPPSKKFGLITSHVMPQRNINNNVTSNELIRKSCNMSNDILAVSQNSQCIDPSYVSGSFNTLNSSRVSSVHHVKNNQITDNINENHTCPDIPFIPQVFAAIIKNAPNRAPLNGTYNNRNNADYIKGLGLILLNATSRLSGEGCLVVFSSYSQMTNSMYHWKREGVIKNLQDRGVSVFVEPHGSAEHLKIFDQFIDAINYSKGAVMCAVCRGKVTEGVDLADFQCRIVLIMGIPFPSLTDNKVFIKRNYMDSQGNGGGERWYVSEAIRSINQAVGRVIRHKDDYGAILFCDQRYVNFIDKLPKWVQCHLKTYDEFGTANYDIIQFFKNIPSRIRKDRISQGM